MLLDDGLDQNEGNEDDDDRNDDGDDDGSGFGRENEGHDLRGAKFYFR